MKTIFQQLLNLFTEATSLAFPNLEVHLFPLEITQSTQKKFGDYQFNSAMKLTKKLKLPPRQIAEKIAGAMPTNTLIETLEIAGPGFINISLKMEFITNSIQKMLTNSKLGIDLPEKERIIVEFSSPNTAKELHVGHLRSTIIGDCLARVFEFLEHDVIRLNHVGDWGTAFGMLIAFMKEETKEVIEGQKQADLQELVTWYKKSKERFDQDPLFKKRAQLEVVALQGGDPQSLEAWNTICAISRKAYQAIYDLLDVKITERGESFYNPMLADTVADLEKKQLITVSDGAKCIFLNGFLNREGLPLPLMVQKSDGGYNYDTTDMAAMRHRTESEKADRIIVITDSGQATHFAMIVEASIKAGYLNTKKTHFHHVPFGLVLGPDGKKFKTRSGETEKLIDLLLNAEKKAFTIVEKRHPDMPIEEQQNLAHVLGIGAVKYADLSSHRTSDYSFSYEKMLKFEGNTAAFVLYAFVRIASIQEKTKKDLDTLKKTASIHLQHSSEIALGLHLLRFGEAIDAVVRDLTPNRLTDYLFHLAEHFNAFFRDCQVVSSAEEDSRLLLCSVTANTLKQGLKLLGLQTTTRM